MVFTVIAYAILILSFRKKYGVTFSYYGIVIVIIRQTARLLDLENTKSLMKRPDWDAMFVFQVAINCIMISTMTIMFQNYKHNKKVVICCLIQTIICVSVGIASGQEFNIQSSFILHNLPFYIFSVLLIVLLGTAIVFYLGRHIPQMLDLIIKKGKFNKKFKQIYDNFDETIIIINKNNFKFEYMNDKFYVQFKEMISSEFIDKKIFEIYKSAEAKLMSIKDIIEYDRP